MGPLTGNPVDKGIIDDPFKDAKEAWSQLVRDNVWEWYLTVFLSRLHNDSQQLITLTRWHEDDLAGRILKMEPEKWEVIVLEAIKESDYDYDIREYGQALWPDKHSLERMQAVKKRNTIVFQSLYQQNPQPAEGVLFPVDDLNYFSVEEIRQPDVVIGACDVADEGDDDLASVTAYVFNDKYYIVDVVYSKEKIETTQPEVAAMIEKHGHDRHIFESNNGGKSYALAVKSLLQDHCDIKWRRTKENKHTRIMMKSGFIKENFYFRNDYERGSQYERFMNNLTTYMKENHKGHDDAPDVCTLLAESVSTNKNPFKIMV
jgi:predicted phage terminase large subunit-like protein